VRADGAAHRQGARRAGLSAPLKPMWHSGHARMRCTLARTCVRRHARTRARTLFFPLSHARTHTSTLRRTHSLFRSLSRTHAHAHAHKHAHAHCYCRWARRL
jgi:hypothetical protein